MVLPTLLRNPGMNHLCNAVSPHISPFFLEKTCENRMAISGARFTVFRHTQSHIVVTHYKYRYPINYPHSKLYYLCKSGESSPYHILVARSITFNSIPINPHEVVGGMNPHIFITFSTVQFFHILHHFSW